MNDTIKELDSIQDALQDISSALVATDYSSDEERDLNDDAANCVSDAIDCITTAIDYLKEAEKMKEAQCNGRIKTLPVLRRKGGN